MGNLISNPSPAIKNLGYITVSAKGISNGLSGIPNGGADFGPDTPNTAGTGLTQTAGIQEALNYAKSKAIFFDTISTGYVLPPIKFLTGLYTLNSTVIFPSFPNITQDTPIFTLLGEGAGVGAPTAINLNGYDIIIGSSSGHQTYSGGFLIQGLEFYSNAYNNASVKFLGNFSANPNCVLRDVSFVNGATLDMSGANNIAQLNMDNVFIFGDGSQFLSPTESYQISITNGTFKSGFYSNGVNQIGAVNFAEGIQINSGDPNLSFNVWELDNNNTLGIGGNGITNGTASGTTSNMTVDVGTLIINSTNSFFNSTGSNGTLNLKLHVKHLVFQTNVMDFSIPSGSNINIQEFTIGEITNNTSSDISTANLPILSSTAGTTAGTIDMRFVEYSSSHKKLIITFNGYENDTSTNQIIDFPLPFNSYLIEFINTTGLSIAYTNSSMTITAPDSTTTYNGFMIFEGY